MKRAVKPTISGLPPLEKAISRLSARHGWVALLKLRLMVHLRRVQSQEHCRLEFFVREKLMIIRHCILLAAAGAVVCAGSTAGAQYTLTTLATFNGANGSGPYAGLISDASGNLYGTTAYGGASGYGTVFKLAAGTHTLTTLVSFNGANGSGPYAGLIADASGNLYGTTKYGGTSGEGTVFEVAAGTHELSTLISFNGVNGAYPTAGLLADANGNLYGTTSAGLDDFGTVFELTNDTHTLITLASFDVTGTNGSTPQAGLIADASGNLYGTTAYGGASHYGTVFELAAGTHALTTLASFSGMNGPYPYEAYPDAGLIFDSSGNLYGTTTNNGGTVFELAADTHALTTLATFGDFTSGQYPHGRLISDSSGNLYGTASLGGSNNYDSAGDGTVFEVAVGTHTLSALATFSIANGTSPWGGLIGDANGNLYGTTHSGGANNAGTVFELSHVPEPATAMLLMIAAVIWCFRQP